jgi:Uma2 family endonuclease
MNQLLTAPLPGTLEDPLYPDSDGRPMGETDFHSVAQIWLRQALEDFFADDPKVYVGSNIIFYWKKGDPESRRDPDVLVAKGVVGKHRRRSYRLWEEKKLPCTLFEIASKKTRKIDLGEKRQLYAEVGVKEYFVFDPEGIYLDPVLQGFRLVKGKSVPMKPTRDGSLVSRQLGLRLKPEGEMLRLYDLKTGEPVLTRDERAEQEKQRAEQERQRARSEKQRAEEERRRREELATEVERLRALLKQQRSQEA